MDSTDVSEKTSTIAALEGMGFPAEHIHWHDRKQWATVKGRPGLVFASEPECGLGVFARSGVSDLVPLAGTVETRGEIDDLFRAMDKASADFGFPA